MPAIGFLHTAEVHVATFRSLVAEIAPDLTAVAVVDADLLSDARRRGVDVVRRRLRQRLEELAGTSVEVIVCTCSTLSGEAESLSPVAGVPVIRVDRPMAEAAVADGGRLALVAALTSTLDPTRALLEQEAAAAAVEVQLVDAPCLAAWDLFERGDVTGYLELLADHVRGLASAGEVDVVVLAQASMAPVASMVQSQVDLPVLSSPRLAVERAAAVATSRTTTSR
jgi:Asp/Glu/hydantoin racemase